MGLGVTSKARVQRPVNFCDLLKEAAILPTADRSLDHRLLEALAFGGGMKISRPVTEMRRQTTSGGTERAGGGLGLGLVVS